jgi:phosphoglycolate phosphatase
MAKKVIIFDFDGVIVDSLDLSLAINRELMPDLEQSEWERWNEGNVYKEIRKEHANDKSADFFFDKYNEQVIGIMPTQGMPEVIKELSKKYILVIISSGTQKAINAYLKKYGLIQHFNDILGRETHHSKVDKFHIILEKYHIQPQETLIITDTVGDIKEANEVGVKSIGVVWGIHNASKLKEANPHFIAMKPSEIITGVGRVLGS